MSEKEIKIVPPTGYEIDKENSTFECIKFKPIKNRCLVYKDIAEELFKDGGFFFSARGISMTNGMQGAEEDANNCTSEEQAKKILAINKLMNVAKYLNGDWKPDWDNIHEDKYYLKITDEIVTASSCKCMCGDIYFKSKELALQAVEILGKDTIKVALSTDW